MNGDRAQELGTHGLIPVQQQQDLQLAFQEAKAKYEKSLRDRDLVNVRPGPGGGITVATAPPQVRVGALDLWFQPSTPHPLDLFEARLYLEFGMTKAAFERATSDDVAAMRPRLNVAMLMLFSARRLPRRPMKPGLSRLFT